MAVTKCSILWKILLLKLNGEEGVSRISNSVVQTFSSMTMLII